MEKIILSTAALSVMVGLNLPVDNPSAGDISGALVKLNADLDSEKKKAIDLQTKLDKQIKLQAEALADGAVADEKITAGAERDELVELAIVNYTLAAKHVSKLKGKASLNEKLNNSNGEIKTVEDFEKLTEEKKLAFKNEKPEDYKKLFATA